MSLTFPVPKFAWKLSDNENTHLDPPTLNTYHEIFDLKGGCKLHYICFIQKNDEHDAKDMNFKFTIDGETYETIGVSCLDNEMYYLYFSDIGTGTMHILTLDASHPFPNFSLPYLNAASEYNTGEVLEMHECKLEAKQTTALGTNQEFQVYYRKSSLEAV